MKIRMTFWMAVAGQDGQSAAVVTADVNAQEYEDTINNAAEAMRLQTGYEMRSHGQEGTTMINMRYVTNYSIERATTVTNN